MLPCDHFVLKNFYNQWTWFNSLGSMSWERLIPLVLQNFPFDFVAMADSLLLLNCMQAEFGMMQAHPMSIHDRSESIGAANVFLLETDKEFSSTLMLLEHNSGGCEAGAGQFLPKRTTDGYNFICLICWTPSTGGVTAVVVDRLSSSFYSIVFYWDLMYKPVCLSYVHPSVLWMAVVNIVVWVRKVGLVSFFSPTSKASFANAFEPR